MEKEKHINIEQLVKDVNKRNTWLRKRWQEIMSMIGSYDVNETIAIDVGYYPLYQEEQHNTFKHYIVLGEDDLMISNQGGIYEKRRYPTWDELSISDIRELLGKMPEIISKIKERLAKKIIKHDDEIVQNVYNVLQDIVDEKREKRIVMIKYKGKPILLETDLYDYEIEKIQRRIETSSLYNIVKLLKYEYPDNYVREIEYNEIKIEAGN